MVVANTKQDWSFLSTTYFSILASGHNVAIKRASSSQWYFGLKGHETVACRVWPATCIWSGKALQFLGIDSSKQPEWLVIDDPNNFEAQGLCRDGYSWQLRMNNPVLRRSGGGGGRPTSMFGPSPFLAYSCRMSLGGVAWHRLSIV